MLYWIFPVVFPPTEWPRWLFSVYRSFLCVTSETPQCQKSHVSSYLIHVLWCMFFCPPLSGVCSSYTAVNELLFFCLSPHSLVTFLSSVLLFMCGPPSLVFLLEQNPSKTSPNWPSPPLFSVAPSSSSSFPLYSPTNKRSSLTSRFRNSAELSNRRLPGSFGVCVCLHTDANKSIEGAIFFFAIEC